MMSSKPPHKIFAALSLVFFLLAGLYPALDSVLTCQTGECSASTASREPVTSTMVPIFTDCDIKVRAADQPSGLTVKSRTRLKRSAAPQSALQQPAKQNSLLVFCAHKRDNRQLNTLAHLSSPSLPFLRTVVLLT